MPAIHVCPLSRVEATVTASGASHLVSLIDVGTRVRRPASIAAERHLYLGVHDVAEAMDGLVVPAEHHIESLLGFLEDWDRTRPLVVHCWAGISRSTAGAFIALCHVAPQRSEAEIAWALRRASRIASPNPLMVRIADRLLGREGRMVAAMKAIGAGRSAFENEPFRLGLND